MRAVRDTQVQPAIANYTFPNVAAHLAAKNGVNPRAYVNFIQTLGDPSMSYNSIILRRLCAGHLETTGERYHHVRRSIRRLRSSSRESELAVRVFTPVPN